MERKSFFVLAALPLLLTSCYREKGFVIDRNGDLLYGERRGYSDVAVETDAATVLSMVDAGMDVYLALLGKNCYPCLMLEDAYSEFANIDKPLIFSFTNSLDEWENAKFMRNAAAIASRYGLSEEEIFTPGFFLLDEDRIERLNIRGRPAGDWNGNLLNSLLKRDCELSGRYFFDEETSFVSFAGEYPSAPLVLLAKGDEEGRMTFMSEIYPKLDGTAGIFLYEEGDLAALQEFGLESYEAYIKVGKEKAPLGEGASLII